MGISTIVLHWVHSELEQVEKKLNELRLKGTADQMQIAVLEGTVASLHRALKHELDIAAIPD